MYKYPLHKIVHLPHYRTDGFTALFWNSTLRSLGTSLVGIFSPLYVFQLFAAIPATFVQAFVAIIWFFLIQSLVVLLVIFPASWFIAKTGFRWSVLVSSLFMLIHLLSLYLAEENLFFLLPAAVAAGVLTPFYWLAYHGIFVEDGKTQEIGQEVGVMGVAARLASAAGPVTGGLVIALLGFHALFALSSAVVLTSAIPLFLIPHHKHHLVVYPGQLWRSMVQSGSWRMIVSFGSRSIEELIHAVFWPLYIFLAVGSYEILGGIASAGLFISVVTVLWVGRLFDKRRKEAMFDLGAGGEAIIWIARAFMRTTQQIFSIEAIDKFISPFYRIPLDAYTYLLAGREDISRFFVFREIVIFSSRTLFLLLLWVMVLWKFSWLLIFGLAALASITAITIVGAKRVRQEE